MGENEKVVVQLRYGSLATYAPWLCFDEQQLPTTQGSAIASNCEKILKKEKKIEKNLRNVETGTCDRLIWVNCKHFGGPSPTGIGLTCGKSGAD